MLLLFDIGNTHTHIGLANDRRVLQANQYPDRVQWFGGNAAAASCCPVRGRTSHPRRGSVQRGAARDAARPQDRPPALEVEALELTPENVARPGH